MNQIKKLKRLSDLSYFDINTLAQCIELPENSLYADIKRWLKSGELISLKRGLYVTKEYYQSQPIKDVYCEFIANKLREPSYLSLEYVLQKYSVLTEAVYNKTSITLKSKRNYTNSLGTFFYRNIKEALFTGYSIENKGGFEIKQASKAKALFDYIYFKIYRMRTISKEALFSLRLNLDEFNQNDWEEFQIFCRTAKILKFSCLYALLRRAYDLQRT